MSKTGDDGIGVNEPEKLHAAAAAGRQDPAEGRIMSKRNT
jgi:hypothetical protein